MGADMMNMSKSEQVWMSLHAEMGNAREKMRISQIKGPTEHLHIGALWAYGEDRSNQALDLESQIFYSFTQKDLEDFLRVSHGDINFYTPSRSETIRSITFDVNGLVFKVKRDGIFFKTKRHLFKGHSYPTARVKLFGWGPIEFSEIMKRVHNLTHR